MKSKKILVVALILMMCFTTLLSGCGKAGNDTLVVGYSYFNAKFSPFFSETAYDGDVAALTQLGLLNADRQGQVVLDGINGETRNYNGTDYTYYGPATCTISDDYLEYTFKLREDLKFSDGEPVTIDDVIFSMYVYADPTFNGSSTFYALPILGMDEYRAGMDARGAVIFKAGQAGYVANDLYTEEQYNAFWNYYNGQARIDFAQEIVDYVIANYGTTGVADSAPVWGFELPENAVIGDFVKALDDAYGGDWATIESIESAGSTLDSLTINGLGAEMQAGVVTGETAPNIAGIQKIDNYTLKVVFTEVDATWYVTLPIAISPLHYYGSKDLYNYEENKFGFPKGDLSSVRAKTTTPMGAGPYKFISFENGVVRFEANENYFLGCPKVKKIQFLESSDVEKVNGVVTGTIDITDPSISDEVIKTIKTTNGNDSLNGDKIITNLVDNLGYGYIGMNAVTMSIDNKPSSDASKNLRKAFGTVFSVFRDLSISSYYGERASVINYPISNTSWAAPQSSDEGYEIAFSKDVNGNPIYTSDMTAEQKYAAAKEAALGFFKAAGFTVVDGKITAAPKGGTLNYKAWIPGDGQADHPSFNIFAEAKKIFDEIGINFEIYDLTDSSQLWDALDSISVQIWAAAWNATVDPDMYQIYFSDFAHKGTAKKGQNPLGGAAQGGSNYEYCIADSQLDELILQGRAVADSKVRKEIYKQALDVVIDWAVEIPVYQRQNAIIFNPQAVNMDTVTKDITTFYSWMAEIEKLELK